MTNKLMKSLLFYFALILINFATAQVSDFNTVNFSKADNSAELNRGMSLNNLPLLVNNLTSKLHTDVEKFRALYMWVCNNITVDATLGNKVTSHRKKYKNDSLKYIKWNTKYRKVVLKKLFLQKKTMCTGYAFLIKELCFLADIKCEIINGYARTVDTNIEKLEIANHSWNAVKLNNKWYLCDAIWASGYIDGNANYNFITDYNDGYFLTHPVLFSKNHYPLQKKWLLKAVLINAPFVASPLVYGETFKHKVIPIAPKKMTFSIKKNNQVAFSFKSLKTIKDKNISLIYFVGINAYNFDITNIKTKNNTTTITTKFKHKGRFDVHLKIENDIVATYTLSVTKE